MTVDVNSSSTLQKIVELGPAAGVALGHFIVEVTSASSEKSTYKALAQHLNKLIPCDRTSITLLNNSGVELDIFALHGKEGVMPVGKSLPLHNSITGRSLLERKGQLTSHIGPDSKTADGQALYQSGLRSCINAPLIIHGVPIGAINSGSSSPEGFTQESVQLLELVATIVATTLERQRLLEERTQAVKQYRSYAQQLENLNLIAQQMATAMSETDVLLIIAESIQQILPSKRISYAVYDKGEHSFTINRLSGNNTLKHGTKLPARGTSLEIALQGNGPTFYPDMSCTEFPEHKILAEGGLVCGWGIPIHKNGEVVGVLNTATDHLVKDGEKLIEVLEILASIMGSTLERIGAQQRVAYQASYDSLTGLPNRHLFCLSLEQMLEHATSDPFALLFIDLDRFKGVNDFLGHPIGDELLRVVAKRIQQVVRASDMVARLGGDEFTVLLSGQSTQLAGETAQRIIKALSRPFAIQEHSIFIGASIGISMAPEHAANSTDLIKYADIAMYNAKSHGRNVYQFYSIQLTRQISLRQQLNNALHKAIENDELYLKFQPLLFHHRVVGVEALLGWHHPEMGEVSPCEFIPVAEESSLIEELTQWVLDNALKTLTVLRKKKPDLYVAVNVSARDCYTSDRLVKLIQACLKRYRLPGNALELEITENIYLHDIAAVSQLLAELKELDIRIAIDDFGTGFSSLTYLLNLPLDTLKIDQSFIKDIHIDKARLGVVRGIIAIADSLNMQCLAEGVENPQQLEQLLALGCQRYQGYLFSPPISAAEFAERF